MPERSRATVQRSLADPSLEYALEPALTAGCPESRTEEIQYPVEVDYEYDTIETSLFERPLAAGLERWQPLLPPLAPDTALGEGNTPVVEAPTVGQWLGLESVVDEGEPTLFVKDESQNPTWSHKDRLNRCTVSSAVGEEATGIVASSTGNHGAAAAAYAARAGLPCVVLTAPETPPAVTRFMSAYGSVVLAVDALDVRQTAVDRLTEEYGFHPVSSRTPVHTGHAWGPEGYKTIAYELYCQLERVPGTVAVPTCYAELLYGVWKGFRELESCEIVDRTPTLVACEPGVRAPLCRALESGQRVASVDPEPTAAYSIKATTSSVRGLRAIRESDGIAVGFTEAHLEASQHRLARSGLWQETSGAAGVAGLCALLEDDGPAAAVTADGTPLDGTDLELDGPVVAIATSSGFKDGAGRFGGGRDSTSSSVGEHSQNRTVGIPRIDGEWEAIRRALEAHEGVPV